MLLPRGSGGRTPTVTELNGKIAYRRALSPKVALEAFIDLFNMLNQQTVVMTDDNYTYSWAGPIVNGTPSDLKYAKDISGAPITKNPNYGNAAALPAPVQRPLRLPPDVLASVQLEDGRPDGGRLCSGGPARIAGLCAGIALAKARGMFVRVASAAVVGIEAAPIDVEVDVGVGLPCCSIVGLADAGIREGRVRIRGALENCGFKLPPRRITVNLAPADLRKDGAAFDVPIAVGMLRGRGRRRPGRARRNAVRRRAGARRRAAAGARCVADRRVGAGPRRAPDRGPARERRRGRGGRGP